MPLAPGHCLGITAEKALPLAKHLGMHVIASIDLNGRDDVVQQFVVDDEFDEKPRHEGLIEGRMETDVTCLGVVHSEAYRARPSPPTPATPSDRHRPTIGKVLGAQPVQDRLQVVVLPQATSP